jgi:hypothetical protein
MNKRKGSSIPWLRIRTQKSGKTYFFLEVPNTSSREEIPLGSDRESALFRRQGILFKKRCLNRVETNEVIFTLQIYQEIAVPLLEPPARRENSASIGKLIDFFRDLEHSWKDVESPEFPVRYATWRGPQLALRIRGELALLNKTRIAFSKWLSDSSLVNAT